MARKVIGMTRKFGRTVRHRRWAALLSLVVLVSAGLVLQAVHDLEFELDGDIDTLGSTPFNSPTFDWEDLFTASSVGNPFGGDTNAALPAGFSDADLTRDFALNANGSFNTSDGTTFATGSKDTLPISLWQCNHDSNVNSKIDIMNAYATAYTAPNGDRVIYFALERNANTGDANVGFWFLQDEVGCVSTGSAVTFTGAHRDGDLLIVSEFSNGGQVSTIKVFRWNIPNPAVDPIGFLDVDNPVAEGVDCRTTGTPAGDSACAAANTDTIAVPWLTAAKTTGVGHTLPVSQFFEGGVNLTQSGIGDTCFNVFIGDTRSSTSPTATLFDFARGQLGQCTSNTVTTPSINGSMTIPTSATVNVTDSATVTVEGVASFTGSVEFHLCGPFALGSATLCDTGGVAAGTQAVTTSGQTVISNSMTVTEVGRYCWRADFSATDPAGIPPSSDSRASECFTILPRTAVLATTAGAGPVNFGQPVTDTATLANTANQEGSGGPAGSTDGSINPTVPGGLAGGTITFTLFKADCTTLATGTGTNPQAVPVNGNGSYGPVSFTPDAPGTYHWFASYSGDLPNTVGTSHNGSCTDPTESVVVQQIPTEIKTKQSWIPNDTATITSTVGNLVAGGSVLFSLHADAACAGPAVFSQNVAVPGGSPTAEVSTNNTTFVITTLYTDPAGSVKGKFSWRVTYTPAAADTAHEGRRSVCDAENFTITYTNDPGPGVKFP